MDKKKELTREEVLQKDIGDMTAEDLEKLTDEDFSFADLDEQEEMELDETAGNTATCGRVVDEYYSGDTKIVIASRQNGEEEDEDTGTPADTEAAIRQRGLEEEKRREELFGNPNKKRGPKDLLFAMKVKKEYYQEKLRDAMKKEEVIESDLIKEYDLADLLIRSGTTVENLYFVVSEYKVYADCLLLKYSVMKDFDILDKEIRIILPREEGKRFYEFQCAGKTLCWDSFDCRHKTKPVVAKDVWIEGNPWVFFAPNKAIRVEKEYAEHNLSEDCLAYGIYEQEGYYIWNMEEEGWYPLFFELRSMFQNIPYDKHGMLIMSSQMHQYYNNMQIFSWTYCKNKGLTKNYVAPYYKHSEDGAALTPEEMENNELILKIMNLQKKEMWTPEEK